MSLNALLIACPDIQTGLRQVWDGVNPLDVGDTVPFFEFLLSPANTNGIQQLVTPGGGKVRNVNLTYSQRLAESTVTEQTGRDCEATGQHEMLVEPYTIDTQAVLKSGELIDITNLAYLCESNSNYINERIAYHMDVVDRAMATKVAGQAAALAGDYSADATTAFGITNSTLEVETKDASGNFKTGAWENIDMAAKMSGWHSAVGFGGYFLEQSARNSEAGCCTSYGLDVGELYNKYGKAYAYDRRLATALGSVTNNSMFMEIGALQLLTYTEFQAYDGLTLNSPYYRFNMTTSRGLPVDVMLKDDCGKLHLMVYAVGKLVAKPTDMFAIGDNFAGVNGTGLVNVNNS